MKIMTMGITRNGDVIRGGAPSATIDAPPKSGDHICIGAHVVVRWPTEIRFDRHFISAFFSWLFSSEAITFSAPLFSPAHYADEDDKRFRSLYRARHGSVSRWQKVTGKYQQKVDILLQLSHHNICSGESLTCEPFRAAMMLSAGEKIRNNNSVVVCNV